MSGHGNEKKPSAPPSHSHGYEPTDAKATPLVAFTVYLTIFTVGCFLAGFIFYRILEAGRAAVEPAPHPMAVERKLADGVPRLQIVESADLAVYRAAMDEKVNGYGWIDRQASLVRVPVSKAIDLLLQNKELKTRD